MYCDGSSLSVVAALRCDIPMQTLRAAPFNLVLGQAVYAKVRSKNSVGPGGWSPPNSPAAKIQTEPGSPASAPTAISTSESSATIGLTHLTGTAAGDSAILQYEISWDQGLGTGVWSTYTVVTSSTSQVTVPGLTSGATYSFKYRGQNLHGWSAGYSPVLALVALGLPRQPLPIRTTMNGASVVLTWSEPYTGGQGVALTAYTVKLLDTTGALAEYTSICQGSNSAVLLSRSCTIPMSAFTSPVNYVSGTNQGGLGLA